MKKIITFIVLIGLFFLVSCGKNIENTNTGSGNILEEIEDPNDITTQKWYKQRMSDKNKDLESFFGSLEKFDTEQLSKLPCDEYYPTKGEYFEGLYDEEKKLIQEYSTKCESLKQTALLSISLSGSSTGTGAQSGTGGM